MKSKLKVLAVVALAAPFAWACKSNDQGGTGTTAGSSAATDGAGTAGGTGTGTGTGGALDVPALVTVNLENVLNDLSVRLNIDRANLPVTIQLPIQVAANVCGVSINVLSVSTGGQAVCTATTASQELAQQVQQQMAAGGSVGGGAQAGTVGGSSPTGSTTGATGTDANSTGANNSDTSTTPPTPPQ